MATRRWRCAVGRSGIAPKQREGDGISPIGSWPIRRIFYRADRLDEAPSKAFACTPIDRQDGWCDAPDHPDYNRLVRLPFAASHEDMWREDHLYDVVVVLGQNDDPVVPWRRQRGLPACRKAGIRAHGGLRGAVEGGSAGIPWACRS